MHFDFTITWSAIFNAASLVLILRASRFINRIEFKVEQMWQHYEKIINSRIGI